MSLRWAVCSYVCIALLAAGCGVFDKANPPPNPVLQLHADTIKAWTDNWCAVSEPHPIVLRIKDAVAPSEIDTTLPISETECNQLAMRILTTKKIELVEGPETTPEDSGFEVLGLFTNLETLILNYQKFVVEDLEKLDGLKALTYLDLSYNDTLHTLDDIGTRHPRLKHLRLKVTGIDDPTLNLESLKELTILELDQSILLGRLPILPASLQKLSAISCNIPIIGDRIIKAPNLVEVNLAGNDLSEAPEIGPRVTRLDLSRNKQLDTSKKFELLAKQAKKKALSENLYVRVGPLDSVPQTDNFIEDLKVLFDNKVRFGKGEKGL